MQAQYTPSQIDVSFFCRNAAGQWYNTDTPGFENYNGANLLDYRIAATETPTDSGIYIGTEPSGATEFELRVDAATLALSYIVAGPASTDAADAAAIKSGVQAALEENPQILLIGTGTALVSAPVSNDGGLIELIIDDDYLAANGRALQWSFNEITGITTSATAKFGIKDVKTGLEVYTNTSGIVTEPTSGTFLASFDIVKTALSALTPGEYDWSVEVTEGAVEITIAKNRQNKTRVKLVEKQT